MPANNFQTLSSVNLNSLEPRLKPVQQMLKRIPLSLWQLIVRALLIVWLVYTLAQIVWVLIPAPAIPGVQIENASGPVTKSKSNIDIEMLKNLTPFGNPAKTSETETQKIEVNDAEDTQLNLILSGLVYSSDEKVARAVIISGDKQDVYAVGDNIPVGNNVSVLKILSDKVIISNGGKHESLWLFKDDPNAPRVQRPAYTNSRSMGSEVEKVVYDNGEGNVAQSSVAQVGTTISDVVAMSIHRENGQIVGYRIRPGRNAEMFESLGLQADDVVTAVNGMPLNNPGKIMEIYRSMGTATSANLQIMRNGSAVNLDISLNH